MNTILNAVSSSDWASTSTSAPAVVLFLHGYGSNERDLAGLTPALGLALPWASLRAPIELGGGAAAWFTITTPGNPDAEPVVAGTDAIWAWVDAKLDPSTRLIPVGFSQGGLMASQLLRTRPDRVLATVVLGGFVLGAVQPADEQIATNRPALFWGRGAEDRVIGQPAIERTSEFLPLHTALVERVYPGLAHGISPDEIDDVRSFIAAAAGDSALTAR
jgi:phospholipase/carboxylesterase